MKNASYTLQKKIGGRWVFKQQYTNQHEAVEGLRFYVDQQTRIGGSNLFRIVTL